MVDLQQKVEKVDLEKGGFDMGDMEKEGNLEKNNAKVFSNCNSWSMTTISTSANISWWFISTRIPVFMSVSLTKKRKKKQKKLSTN